MLNFEKNKDFPKILRKKGAINDLEELILADFGSWEDVYFVSDQKIMRNSGQFLPKTLFNKLQNRLILKNPHADDQCVSLIKEKTSKSRLIIAFGSGVINDLCKISAKELGIEYVIIASAASMNGYVSKNASISIMGHKKTLPAICPSIVVADMDILKSAPKRLTKAGIGDSLCFYSCWFDWYLSHKILDSYFDEELLLMQKDKVDNLLKNYQKFSLADDKLFEILIDILLLSGWSMTLAGGSYPASQSEHLISHVMEMKYGNQLTNSLHGLQIALTSLMSAKIQEKLLLQEELTLQNTVFPYEELSVFFDSHIARQCQEQYQHKIYDKHQLSEINKNLRHNWPEIRQKLQKIHLKDTILRDIFQHFDIRAYPSAYSLHKDEFLQSVKSAKFIRDRFTCLDLLDFRSFLN